MLSQDAVEAAHKVTNQDQRHTYQGTNRDGEKIPITKQVMNLRLLKDTGMAVKLSGTPFQAKKQKNKKQQQQQQLQHKPFTRQ